MFLQQADTNSKSLLCLHRKAHSATYEAVGDMPPPSGAQQCMIPIRYRRGLDKEAPALSTYHHLGGGGACSQLPKNLCQPVNLLGLLEMSMDCVYNIQLRSIRQPTMERGSW